MTGSKYLYEGAIVRLEVADLALPNGERLRAEVVHHPGGAAAVALDGEGRVCLLRQYRPVIDAWLWELPAGKRDGAEPPLETARRELAEEAGRQAADWTPLGTLWSSPGVFTERIWLYLARGLTAVPAAAEVHECFEVHWRPLGEALAEARGGALCDAKTVVGLCRAAAFLAGDAAG